MNIVQLIKSGFTKNVWGLMVQSLLVAVNATAGFIAVGSGRSGEPLVNIAAGICAAIMVLGWIIFLGVLVRIIKG